MEKKKRFHKSPYILPSVITMIISLIVLCILFISRKQWPDTCDNLLADVLVVIFSVVPSVLATIMASRDSHRRKLRQYALSAGKHLRVARIDAGKIRKRVAELIDWLRNPDGRIDRRAIIESLKGIDDKASSIQANFDHGAWNWENISEAGQTMPSGASREQLCERTAQDAWAGSQMDIGKIKEIIGKLVEDERFRKSFFQDRVNACRYVGYDLTVTEVAALRNLKEESIEEFSNSLDERVTKIVLDLLL